MTIPARDFFDRPVVDVARDLLGATLTRHTPQGTVALRITEVEAYDGTNDPGSHAFRGPNRRNETMFGEPGRLYVYRHLGLHYCANVVCGPEGTASAVLLRAGEVTGPDPDGVALARARRLASGVVRADRDLARGPARLAVALGLDLADDGADVTDPEGAVVLEAAGAPSGTVLSGPRVGVSGDGGRADLYPWRFWLDGEPTVSVYRAAQPRRRPSA
ncbi:DNA-3-methyladenine glycosylase [Promicromonospora sp. AC04]|uniref:DNA-3-methyladenine glycosylase n=1 Tax=Promicromonospora sp. AC04 TaxID=2135723 RepID=UPI000D36E5D6|nr:DNA-3-methyladenine glycosylase [Promicromonospora sp. AC04]PUB31496.1 DNA-3-methyladenine glycosylase [Promicromonospora sp. AC04]